MAKNYVTPEMEITEFDTEDVITTSGGIGDGGGQIGGSGVGDGGGQIGG